MSNLPGLSDGQFHTLTNAVVVGIEKYEANARELRAYAEHPIGPNAIVSKEGAIMLAEQFDAQATEARELLDFIMEANDG